MTACDEMIILLHGFTGCAAVWDEVITSLSGPSQTIALDLPGHGSRTGVEYADTFTFDGACNLISEQMTRRGLKRTGLWGYSMGGRIALQFALKNPDRIGALVIESASPGLVSQREREARIVSDNKLAEKLESEGLERFIEGWMDQPLLESQKSLPVNRRELGRKLRLGNDVSGLAAALRGFSIGLQEPLHNRLQDLTMPTLVIAGELDSKYRAIGESMAHSIPNAQFRIIPSAGHAPHWERPVETAETVAAFLDAARRI